MKTISAVLKGGRVLALVAGVVGACLGTQSAYADPGDFDVTFGGDGIVERPGGSIATYPDARTLVAFRNGNNDIVVDRLTQTGSPDLSFGWRGRAVIAFPGYDVETSRIALQADGRIVAAATVCDADDCHFAAARLLATGQYDSTFALGGRIVVPIGRDATASGLAIDPLDGGILLAGFSTFGSDRRDFALLRLTPSGWPDSAFGNGGRASTYFGFLESFAYNVAVQSTGKIVLAGAAGSNWEHDMALARFNRDGSLDRTFGSRGLVVTKLMSGTGNSRAHNLALQSTDAIIVSGPAAGPGSLIRRYTPDGVLDASFNGGAAGLVLANAGDIYDIAIQDDDKIVGVAYYDYNAAVVFRLRSWGLLDTGFGNLGYRGLESYLLSVAVQSYGCIMLGGPGMIVRLVGDPRSPAHGAMPGTQPCHSQDLPRSP